MSKADKEHVFSYMQPSNLPFLEELYEKWLKDPTLVEPSWHYFFEGMRFGESKPHISEAETGDAFRIARLIDAYRRFGHLQANTNPLRKKHPVEQLKLETLGFKEAEMDQFFPTCGLLEEESAPLSKIIDVMRETYCRAVGLEYMGKHAPELETWIQAQIEPTRFKPQLTPEQRKEILEDLNKAELLETFIHTKYVGQKRFSLEGGETLIPIISALIEEGAEEGIDEWVIGMSHRGRLNVLTNILNKSYSMVFGEFEDYIDPNYSGDVKYHKGFSSNIETRRKKKVHVSLNANPSHLESVDPIVLGKVKAKQQQRQDFEKSKVAPLLIHGDASLAGQGVVYETLQLYNLPGYGCGGCLHIVVNNQIGFTTLPNEYASTPYCTDIAHAFEFPVFHVNAEDPEGCVYAAILALRIRKLFKIDVFIDLTSYRKYGHNESDEPAFTQPHEYQLIRQKKSIREIYRDFLIQQGVLEKNLAMAAEEEFKKALHYELEEMKLKKESVPLEAFGGVWKEYRKASKQELLQPIETAVDYALLQEIGKKICEVPENFSIHPKLMKLIEYRMKMMTEETPLDFPMAEQLSFGSLLFEKIHVRLSGQDSQRGTFTQRHAVWVDQKSDHKYFPLSHLREGQGVFNVYNSPLSEFGVLGFEFGYSLAYPAALVLWEAQFGDFANGAQVILDQYISCSEQKWNRFSGLTLLLPHGYEGQGSEHSSARLERFLQLAGESNMQIVYPTTPAQYFHLLRRQVKRNVRIPLVIFTPKGLLRYPKAISSLKDLASGTFKEFIDDDRQSKEPKRLILCTGRIYYDLIEEREKRGQMDIAIVRIEQLYPLHIDKLKGLLEKYKGVNELYWVQEEPKNMGAYHYIFPILNGLLASSKTVQYVGRSRSASTATGSHARHEKEQKELMNMAFNKD